jgi:hypothetical protein
MSRECASVTLSRGRVANHLYLVAAAPSERDAFAWVSREAPDPRAALAYRLSRSQAETLGIYVSEPQPRVVERPPVEREGGRSLSTMRGHDRGLGWRRASVCAPGADCGFALVCQGFHGRHHAASPPAARTRSGSRSGLGASRTSAAS